MVTIPEHAPYIQGLQPEWYKPYVSGISMLRLDVIHPVVSGNKWYKLKHNIIHAINGGYESILTFGGVYSNHLIATALAAKEYGIKAIGIVRGVLGEDKLTSTLKDCLAYGMQLVFVSREEYAKKTEQIWLDELDLRFDHPFIIPEGGANEFGRLGAGEIASYITEDFSHVCVSVGTGTTLIGLRNELPAEQIVLGYTPVKGGVYLKNEITPYLHANRNLNWELLDDTNFGGFGKWNDNLLSFMNAFYKINKIPLDIVYTGKMMFNIGEQLKQVVFPAEANILCIHTGGLQGNASVKERLAY
jgi:1-aminocyclopropane-1-carboxylate deaminase